MAKKPPRDTWARPPFLDHSVAKARAAEAVETDACRKILAAYGLSVHNLRAAAGTPGGTRVTFEMLGAHYAFPREPAVAADMTDTPAALLAAFDKTRLWADWVAAWDLRPAVPAARRALVFKARDWGFAVLYGGAPPPDRAHLVVAAGRTRLTVEPLLAWARGLDWNG